MVNYYAMRNLNHRTVFYIYRTGYIKVLGPHVALTPAIIVCQWTDSEQDTESVNVILNYVKDWI